MEELTFCIVCDQYFLVRYTVPISYHGMKYPVCRECLKALKDGEGRPRIRELFEIGWLPGPANFLQPGDP